MAGEWLEEGLRQFRLAAVWEGCARALQETAPTTAARLREQVLGPFLSGEWLPGLRGAVPAFVRRLGDNLAEVRPGVESACARLRSELTPALAREGQPGWQLTLRQAVRALAGGAEGEQGEVEADLTRPATMTALWLKQAIALGAWRALRPELDGLNAAGDPAAQALAQRCASLAQRIARRNQEGSALGWLVYLHSSKDYRLFEQVQAALADCSEALARVPATTNGSPGGNLAPEADLPADWPPRVLADLEHDLAAAGGEAFRGFLARIPTGDAIRGDWFKAVGGKLKEAPARVLGRLALVRAVVKGVEGLCASAAVDPQVWQTARESVPRLTAGTGFQVELLRDPRGPCEGCTLRRDPTATALEVRRTGIRLRHGQGPPVLLRPAEFLLPPAVIEALSDLARWLERGPDAALAGQCRDLAAQLKGTTLPAWWAAADLAERARLWRVLQGALGWWERTADRSGPPFRLLYACAEEGFQIDPGDPRPTGPEAVEGPWFLSLEGASPPKATDGWEPRYGPLLRSSEGQSFGPAVWLRLPEAHAAARPLLRCLADIQPLLALLQASDPQWRAWEDLRIRLWSLWSEALPGPDMDASGDGAIAREVFTAVYARRQEAPPELAAAWTALAARVYRCLTAELGLELQPRLDPQTLEPKRFLGPPERGTVRYRRDPSPVGTVLEVRQFGDESAPADVEVSIGPRLPGLLGRWFSLPQPPALGQAAARSNPLVAWHQETRRLLWRPDDTEAAAARAREQFSAWLAGPQGAEWFDALARTAGETEARQWLDQLKASGWCSCFPDRDPQSGELVWPAGAPTNVPGIQWAFDDAVRRGCVLGEVGRFAPRPEEAICTVSLGAREPGTPLDSAWQLREGALALPGPKGRLKAAAEAVWAETLHGGSEPPLPRAEELAGAVLEVLPAAAGEDPEAAEAVLTALRGWCRPQGLEVLPRRWTYAREMRLEELELEERASPVAIFHASPPRTLAGVRVFGLARDGAAVRSCKVMVSAGPPPAGFPALYALVQEGRGPERELRRRLDAWPELRLQGPDAFEYMAVEFFIAFWGELGEDLRTHNAGKAQQFGDCLGDLLQEEFALTTFHPDSAHGLPPDWVEFQARTRGGRIKKVLRPGLKDARGELRVPAVVKGE